MPVWEGKSLKIHPDKTIVNRREAFQLEHETCTQLGPDKKQNNHLQFDVFFYLLFLQQNIVYN